MNQHERGGKPCCLQGFLFIFWATGRRDCFERLFPATQFVILQLNHFQSLQRRNAMTKFHPFFDLGSVGIKVISLLDIVVALVLGFTHRHTAFFSLHPVFLPILVPSAAFSHTRVRALQHANKSC